jgi:hypothetical protein
VESAVGDVTESPSISGIADVVFIVQLELRERESRLARLTPSAEAAAVIGECEGALRRICKGLGAIDVVLAPVVGGRRVTDFTTELEESLLVRRAYARIRRFFEENGEPSEVRAREVLRTASARLAGLVEGSVSGVLRVEDRLLFLELLARMRSWLMDLEGRPTDGVRIWSDAAAFAHMLVHINRRQELVRHDTEFLTRLVGRGEGRPASPSETQSILRALEGLDDDLDTALHSGAEGPEVDGLLLRLAIRLGVPRAHSIGSPP